VGDAVGATLRLEASVLARRRVGYVTCESSPPSLCERVRRGGRWSFLNFSYRLTCFHNHIITVLLPLVASHGFLEVGKSLRARISTMSASKPPVGSSLYAGIFSSAGLSSGSTSDKPADAAPRQDGAASESGSAPTGSGSALPQGCEPHLSSTTASTPGTGLLPDMQKCPDTFAHN